MKLDAKRALLISCALNAACSAPSIAQVVGQDAAGATQDESPAAQNAQDVPVQAQAGPVQSGPTEIVVTARRREEALSRTPVSVTALSSDMLAQRSISSLDELAQAAPGLNFGQSGGSSNPQVVIRGQSRANLGDAAQPVLTYFSDVPLPYVSQIIPTYDLASIQVLKGPQGTLFGRNSTSGALLVYPVEPSYNLEGYVMGGYGNYNRIEAEGAINVPIVADHVALRAAGRIERRDGYVTSIYTGLDLDNRRDDSFRVSLLLESGDLRNVTVYDYSEWNRNGDAAFLTHIYPGSIVPRFPGFNAFFDCGTSPTCDIDLALQQQATLGRHRNQTGTVTSLHTRVTGLINTTTFDLGDVTFKNVLGYRTALSDNVTDTDGTAMGLTIAEQADQSFRQFSNEFQVQATLFDGRVDAIGGVFYLKAEPNATQGLVVAAFVPLVPAFVVQSYRTQTSTALFGQASIEVMDGLKIDLGARHTWDKTEACALGYGAASPYAPNATPLASEDQCRNGGTITVPGVGAINTQGSVVSGDSQAWTWNLGANYQLAPEYFIYGTARRGYRAGGVNTPTLAGTLAQFQTYEPETVTDFEVGFKANWRSGPIRATMNIDVFQSTFNGTQRGVNGLSRDFDGSGSQSDDPSGGTIIINAGKSRVRGVDFDATLSPVPGLTIAAFATYNHQEYLETGTPAVLSAARAFPTDPADVAFPYAPDLTAGGSISYEQDLGDGSTVAMTLDLYHANRTFYSPFKSDLALSMAPYELLNGRIDFKNVYDTPLSIGFYMRNILDTEYYAGAANSATSSGYASMFYGAPRTYGLQLRLDF